MKSYTNYQRIEGLILLVKYYYEMRRYLLAYSLSMVCLMTNEIPDIGCNEYVYKFEKYLVHSKICYHIQKFEEGEITLKKGIEYMNEDMPNYKDHVIEIKELLDEFNAIGGGGPMKFENRKA